MSHSDIYAVPDHFSDAHITAESYKTMYERSLADPDGFWADLADEFLTWDQRWTQVQSAEFTAGKAD